MAEENERSTINRHYGSSLTTHTTVHILSHTHTFAKTNCNIMWVTPLYSVYFSHTCVHIMMTHRHMLTPAPCLRLIERSHHTHVCSHCSCASHGIVLNASRNLDATGAWSQTTASGNGPFVPCSRGAVLVISDHGRVVGSVNGACGEEHRVDAETRDGESNEHSDTNSTASLDAVGHRHEVAQAASSV